LHEAQAEDGGGGDDDAAAEKVGEERAVGTNAADEAAFNLHEFLAPRGPPRAMCGMHGPNLFRLFNHDLNRLERLFISLRPLRLCERLS